MTLGRAGEQWAAEYLRGQGYEILERNWHCFGGEIDLIAAKGPFIVFVEVKTRKSDSLEGTLEAVSPAKQRRLMDSAQQYLLRNPTEHRQPRMDVCAILAREGIHSQRPQIYYIENAF